MSATPSAAGAWSQIASGDGVSRSIGLLLLAMSVLSWTLILSRSWFSWRAWRSLDTAIAGYWSAHDQAAGLAALQGADRCRLLLPMASAVDGLTDAAARTRALREALGSSRRALQGGLTALASVASTAPFVGLLGTVWGIYHALIGISASGQASIDRVAGPVGEALIMTAIGLAVAVPAVLGYNWLVRRNKAAMEEVNAFGSDLHAVLLGSAKK